MSEDPEDGNLPLAGVLVVALEQAVAAPYCTAQMANAGARIIKLERPDGDFARYYDKAVAGESSYFVWLNRGKESVTCDLSRADDRALLTALLEKADVFIQNLKPGALERLGFPIEDLRRQFPRLIACSVSGFSDEGAWRDRKAYDLLIQAEAGLAAVTGGPEAPSRIGVSIVDVATGAAALQAILEALLLRERTGKGAEIKLSMFDVAADWMSVPFLHAAAGAPPKRMGLAHPSIAPYGVFTARDGKRLLISIQNEREWILLCDRVLNDPDFARDLRFNSNIARVNHRAETDARVAAHFAALTSQELAQRLLAADIAFAFVNDVTDLLVHPELKTTDALINGVITRLPASAARFDGLRRAPGTLPSLGAQDQSIRAEFLASLCQTKQKESIYED